MKIERMASPNDMTEVKINEDRFASLIEHEQEAMQLFEAIVRYFVADWRCINMEIKHPYKDTDAIAEFINKRLEVANIKFNGEGGRVWFASGDILLYWSYRDSKSIYVSDLLK